MEEQGRRKVGRPRKEKGDGSNRRELILAKATELFNENGYSHTSMSDIARAVGLDQSSLYYWYKGKELIFADIVKSRKPVSITYETFQTLPEDWALRLYVAVHTDMLVLCDLPFDYYTVEEVVLDCEEVLDTFMEKYRRLIGDIEATIVKGMEAGAFGTKDPKAAVVGIIALNEGLQHKHHLFLTHGIGCEDYYGDANLMARVSAAAAVRSLNANIDLAALHERAVEGGWISA